MSMQDPVADMLTRIRNGQMASKQSIELSSSRQKVEVARVLKEEGFIKDYSVQSEGVKNTLIVELKYFKGKPVIDKIKRVSKPSLRIYKSVKQLTAVPGFGIQILSTSKGIMTHMAAKKMSIGGEVICEVA